METQREVVTLSLMEAMDRAIKEIPYDKKGKVHATITQKDAEVAFVYRYKDLETGAYVRRGWNGKVEGGGKITWEW